MSCRGLVAVPELAVVLVGKDMFLKLLGCFCCGVMQIFRRCCRSRSALQPGCPPTEGLRNPFPIIVKAVAEFISCYSAFFHPIVEGLLLSQYHSHVSRWKELSAHPASVQLPVEGCQCAPHSTAFDALHTPPCRFKGFCWKCCSDGRTDGH